MTSIYYNQSLTLQGLVDRNKNVKQSTQLLIDSPGLAWLRAVQL